jgi:glycerol-3-phosphate acyltransferase PlsY
VRALLPLLGYACGAIPVGVLLARFAGVDPRRAGSGNVGATNVARTAGAALGLATLAGDVLKGALPVLVARALDASLVVVAATAVGAVLGHVFPATLRFAGGKGVATALGALLVLAPAAAIAAVVVFALAFGATRWVSVASLAAATTVPLAVWAAAGAGPELAASALMAALVAVRHRDNVRRLRAGVEPRFELHKRQAPPTR